MLEMEFQSLLNQGINRDLTSANLNKNKRLESFQFQSLLNQGINRDLMASQETYEDAVALLGFNPFLIRASIATMRHSS